MKALATTTQTATQVVISSADIMQVGMGFWASKTLLVAIKLSLFTELGESSLNATQLQSRLGLRARSSVDFFDALVSIGLLHRHGSGAEARYCNTLEASLFLVNTSPAYVGGLLEMASARLDSFWESLEEGLDRGDPEPEVKQNHTPILEALYAQPALLELFLAGMAQAQMATFTALADRFTFNQWH